MAHTFRNLGFEEAGPAPGSASGWFTASNFLTESWAEYGPLRQNGESVDAFEDGWGNEGFKFQFVGILQDVTPAQYHPGVGLDSEDFEQQWFTGDILFNHNSSVLVAADYSGEDTEDFEAFEGDLARLDDGYPEIVGAVDGIPEFLTGPDEIQIVGFDWAARGFATALPIEVRLSNGTSGGPNSDFFFDLQSVGGVVGDKLILDGPEAATAETGNAKTIITQSIIHDSFDSLNHEYHEDFENADWPALVSF